MDWTADCSLYSGPDNDPENILASLDIQGYRIKPAGSRVYGSTQGAQTDADSNEVERLSLSPFKLGLSSDQLYDKHQGALIVAGMEQPNQANNFSHLQQQQGIWHTSYSSSDARNCETVHIPPHAVDSMLGVVCDSVRDSLKPQLASIRIPASGSNMADIRNRLKLVEEAFDLSSVDMAAIGKDIASLWEAIRGRAGLSNRLSTTEGRQKALQSKMSQLDKILGPKLEDWVAMLKRHQLKCAIKQKEAQTSAVQADVPALTLGIESEVENNKDGSDYCNQQQQLQLEGRLHNLEVRWSALENRLLSELKSNGETVALAHARMNTLEEQVRIAHGGMEKLMQTVMKIQKD